MFRSSLQLKQRRALPAAAPRLSAFRDSDSDDSDSDKVGDNSPPLRIAQVGSVAGTRQSRRGEISRQKLQTPEQLKETGDEHAEAGDFESALTCWLQALGACQSRRHQRQQSAASQDPDSDPAQDQVVGLQARLHEQCAQVYLELDQVWRAIRAAESAALLAPSWSQAHHTLGRARMAHGDLAEGVQSLRRCVKLAPPDPEALRAELCEAEHCLQLREDHFSEAYLEEQAELIREVRQLTHQRSSCSEREVARLFALNDRQQASAEAQRGDEGLP